MDNKVILQNRLRSPVLWVSVAALIGFIAKTYFNYEIPEWNTLVDMVLIVLAGFGIVNSPDVKNKL